MFLSIDRRSECTAPLMCCTFCDAEATDAKERDKEDEDVFRRREPMALSRGGIQVGLPKHFGSWKAVNLEVRFVPEV